MWINNSLINSLGCMKSFWIIDFLTLYFSKLLFSSTWFSSYWKPELINLSIPLTLSNLPTNKRIFWEKSRIFALNTFKSTVKIHYFSFWKTLIFLHIHIDSAWHPSIGKCFTKIKFIKSSKYFALLNFSMAYQNLEELVHHFFYKI